MSEDKLSSATVEPTKGAESTAGEMARLENGKVIIEIDVDDLAHSQEHAEWNWDGDKQCLKVTHQSVFAAAVVRELNRENSESGLTRIQEILDRASMVAVESGCGGCIYANGGQGK